MPRSAPKPFLRDMFQPLQALVVEASRFVPKQRGDDLFRKWLKRGVETLPEERVIAMMADAVLLTADLLLSQPSASGGTTAFDRLAGSLDAPSGEVATAIAALRRARYRLLMIEDGQFADEFAAHDVVSGERMRLVRDDDQAFSAGMTLFGRVAMLDEGVCCLPGAVTPLDAAAFEVAHGHPAAGQPGLAAGARWAEAIYAHVVAHGTLDVPGLNRPREGFDEDDPLYDEDDPLLALANAWAALEGSAPDAALLQQTRQMVDLPFICNGSGFAAAFRDAGQTAVASALERLLAVQLETVLNRERMGSGTLTLDLIDRSLEQAIRVDGMPSAARDIFRTLRARLPRSQRASGGGDPALDRLMQRIQGLRSKTLAQGCTEQEALAAAEKVAELLDRHGLSLSELDFRAQPCDGIGIQTTRRRFAPIDQCIPAIATFFDCRVWAERATGAPLRYVFFGLRSDVAAAQYLYELVERAFETETAVFRAGAIYAGMAGERRSAANSFQIGLARGISAKLETLRTARSATQRSASGRDLVPVKAAMVNEEMEKLGLDLRSRGVGQRKHLLKDAYLAGQAAGEQFDFAPAISHAA
jgi:hypothetical protein